MNTSKRERIIKNLYDLQCLDSWEDGEHFMEAVEGIRIHFGIKWIPLESVQDSIIGQYKEEMRFAPYENVMDAALEDGRYIETLQYMDTQELFSDITCSSMKFDDFRTLCLEYMDFSQLI